MSLLSGLAREGSTRMNGVVHEVSHATESSSSRVPTVLSWLFVPKQSETVQIQLQFRAGRERLPMLLYWISLLPSDLDVCCQE